MNDSVVVGILNSGVNPRIRKTQLKAKFGKKATAMGLRLSTTASFKEDLFKSRIKIVDELLCKKCITSQEAKKRKMEAAFNYYGYLKENGYYDQAEYDAEMLNFADSIGALYVPSSGTRTK